MTQHGLALAFFAILLTCMSGICGAVSVTGPKDEIDRLMAALQQRSQFNGAILVAKQGAVVYKKGFGKANYLTGLDFTPGTPSDIGSVTKQFTAMAIMILAQKGKLTYDDSVSKYIPEFSRSTLLHQITLRQLLTHTSGIPDYGDLDIDDAGLDSQQLISALLSKEGAFGKPGLRYRYSNPGYALLAVVVKRASGIPFSDYLNQEIFRRVGMRSTFVYDKADKKTDRVAIGYGQFGQVDDVAPTAIPGDGGIYSTVDDLFKWDQTLYTDELVPQAALVEAFSPGKAEQGTPTYGFGWNIGQGADGKFVWHQGNQAGFRAFIERRLNERVSVIMLTNRGSTKRQEINAAIQNILAGKPYVLPRQSGAEKLYKVIHESGLVAALNVYNQLKGSADYDMGESELNTLGYQLLYADAKPEDAIAILELNATEHAGSSNAFDSLGEAYQVKGDRNRAVNCYELAVRLDQTNGHAAAMLKKLKRAHALWVIAASAIAVGVLILVAIMGRKSLRKHFSSLA